MDEYCRGCEGNSARKFLDLGIQPLSNANLSASELYSKVKENKYPLEILVCSDCWLVQTKDYVEAQQIFKNDYPYYSSTSISWLEHCRNFTEGIAQELGLSDGSFVVEIASNDGYLLKNFVRLRIPCLGIEPTDGTANIAEKQGIPVLRKFFGLSLALELVNSHKQADLIIANNVLAHVPDINDFIAGLKHLLKKNGVSTIEFPHLMNLISSVQFDTFYHEHFSYLSVSFLVIAFKKHNLRIFRVEKLSTHGGSLRVYVCHEDGYYPEEVSVNSILIEEESKGMNQIEIYREFGVSVERSKVQILEFLKKKKLAGNTIAGYGAAAKANTLLNYLNVGTSLVSCVFDAAPAKQGKFMPGSHIPILSPSRIYTEKPDFIWIFPWNLVEEIAQTLEFTRSWNAQLFITNPELCIL